MLSLASLVFGLAVAADAAGAVRVSASRSGLAVMAEGAPLSVVLEEIGRHSGTRVTYEGAAPGTLLTCDFVAGTPGEAFLRALEGSGLNYALYGGTLEAPGILIISAPSGAAGTPQASAVPPQAATRRGQSSGEVAAAIDSPDEEPLPLAEPPPGGATPPRFMRSGEGEPISEASENGLRPSAEPDLDVARPPARTPPSLEQDERRERARERMGRPGRRGGANNPQN